MRPKKVAFRDPRLSRRLFQDAMPAHQKYSMVLLGVLATFLVCLVLQTVVTMSLHPQVSLQSASSILRNDFIRSIAIPEKNILPKVMVIYFPQYHPDPINDKNWGEGFTDWKSLQGSPEKNKLGYKIPRPTEFGYYDLRNTTIRKQQAELAKAYDVDGFIIHHYWFYDLTHPGPNLHAPLMEMLKDGEPNIPFFFNWCAVKWINVWMGKSLFQTGPTNMNNAITIQEQYFNATDAMIREHYQWLKPFFALPNYMKIDGQPIFFTYKWNDLMEDVLVRLRQLAVEDGYPGLYLMTARSGPNVHLHNKSGLDERLVRMMAKRVEPLEDIKTELFNKTMTYPYPLEYVTRAYELPKWCLDPNSNEPLIPHEVEEITGVLPCFDNTPRREFKEAKIYYADTPDNVAHRFYKSLYAALYFHTCCVDHGKTRELVKDSFVAVNAWNEWAEGMSLEPSDVYGRKFLEVLRDVKDQVREDFKANNGCARQPN